MGVVRTRRLADGRLRDADSRHEVSFSLDRENLDLETGGATAAIDTVEAPQKRVREAPPPSAPLPPPPKDAPEAPAAADSEESRLYRAAQLADFGFPDDGLVGSTLYAARVLSRRLNLRMARQRIERDLVPARDAFNQALLPLGKALCARQEDRALEALAPMFEAIEAARRAARDKDTAREQVRVSSANVQKELEESHGQSENAASRIRAREDELAAQETLLRTKLKRAQALADRCDIELRAMQSAATAPDPGALEACQERKRQRGAEADALKADLTKLLGDLGETRRSLASARGALSELEGKRRAQDTQHRKVDGKHAKHAAKAHSRLESAIVDLAVAALEKDLADLGSPEGQNVEQARLKVAEIENNVAHHLDAEAAYDHEAFGAGVKVLGAIGAGLVAAAYLLAS